MCGDRVNIYANPEKLKELKNPARKEIKEEKTAEKTEEPQHNDEVEDISIASKKPIIDDDDIPPFLRKLRR